MEATTAETHTAGFAISPDHVDAAMRYIAAIVRRDSISRHGQSFIDARSQELLEQFLADYAALSHGPYSRRGTDALHIAMGRL